MCLFGFSYMVYPFEYQYLELAEQMGHLIGFVERVNWEDRISKNIRFM